MTANTYGRQVIVALTNKSGGSVAAGDVVIIDTTNNDAFTTTTSAGSTVTIGVAQETIANNASGRVLTQGYAALINVNASVTRGNYGKTHTVAKQATDAGSVRVAGTFCQFLTGGTTPDAMVYSVDLAGAALTNPMTTVGDIIQGASSGTPARLAAGTAGQFLMGAGAATSVLWASRELDYVEITSDVALTATTEGTAQTVITGTSQAYTAVPIMIEFYSARMTTSTTAASGIVILLYDGATVLGRLALLNTPAAAATIHGGTFGHRLTPTAATHQYIIKAYTTTTGATISAGAGGTGTEFSAYLRITRAT